MFCAGLFPDGEFAVVCLMLVKGDRLTLLETGVPSSSPEQGHRGLRLGKFPLQFPAYEYASIGLCLLSCLEPSPVSMTP